MARSITRGIAGTVASIVASVLILVVMVGVYLVGPQVAFQEPCVYVLGALILVGLWAYYGYLGYARHALWRMKYVSPVALALGTAAIVAGYKYGVEYGGLLVFLSYIVETSVGIKLYRDYAEEDPLGAKLFLAGVTMFVVSLPLVLLDRRAALLGIVGDIVKLAGLLLVLFRLLEERSGA